MAAQHRKTALVFGIWISLIFITSCFVIPFDVFVAYIQRLSGSGAFKAGFAEFWGASWFFVVKGWHMTEYAILLTLARPVFQLLTRSSYRRSLGIAWLFAALFAASDEWHQTFVPGRDGNFRDVCIDCAGAGIAAVVLLVRERRRTTPARAATEL